LICKSCDMSDLRSSNIYDMLDEDGGASAAIPKKDAKSTPAEKPSNKKVDAPPKKEKLAKSEEPAAPLGKEQRGERGRDSKPRGRGRDNKGGLRRPAGTGREFDRRSGPSATHRNPREGKRHGGGQHNWGDPVEEATKAAQTTEETPVSPAAPADENKTETPVATTTENKEAEQKEPQEEEDKTLTYDQFLQKKHQQAPEGDKLEARAVDNDSFQGVAVKEVASEKKKKGKKDDKEEEKGEKGARKKKNIVTLDEFNASLRQAREPRPPRTENAERGASGERGGRGGAGGRGRGAPRGGARGGGRGRGGPRSQAPVVDDGNFPKLGK